jgi:hypothetical protein
MSSRAGSSSLRSSYCCSARCWDRNAAELTWWPPASRRRPWRLIQPLANPATPAQYTKHDTRQFPVKRLLIYLLGIGQGSAIREVWGRTKGIPPIRRPGAPSSATPPGTDPLPRQGISRRSPDCPGLGSLTSQSRSGAGRKGWPSPRHVCERNRVRLLVDPLTRITRQSPSPKSNPTPGVQGQAARNCAKLYLCSETSGFLACAWSLAAAARLPLRPPPRPL